MPLCPPSSTGINDTPFVDTWHGKPGNALSSQQSSAGNGTSGLIAGLPSRSYNARNASTCSCCVAVHWHTPCWFGVITNHLPPRPTKPPTQRSSVIPSGIVVCLYHEGGGLNETIVLVIARVEGIGPMLPILEGGCCVCLFVSGQHRLRWQHWVFLLGPGGQNLHPTSLPTPLPPVFNKPTTFTLSGKIIASYLVSGVLINLGPSSNDATEEWAAMTNASYCYTLASMYRQWAPFPLADLVSYLSRLRSQNVTTWLPLSSDWDTLQ
jgi:hypothetical protein